MSNSDSEGLHFALPPGRDETPAAGSFAVDIRVHD